jgi:hypothetical protein
MTTNQTSRELGDVKVRVLANTVCKPHGPISAGQIVTVSNAEYHQLRAAHKVVRVADAPAESKPEPQGEPVPEPKRSRSK